MKLTAEIPVYEVNEEPIQMGKTKQTLLIKSHWNQDNLVIISIKAMENYTIKASDLKKAINRCSHWRW